ncbi:MAG: hypothetical protein CMF71_06650 [Magnetovibrio sp.]|nr:hypothetical protein [Magnetovibrio sp.]|tara:strand:- start:370 stop:612 length:243 start_codon:yes stop_codon:yes gene_type:complete
MSYDNYPINNKEKVLYVYLPQRLPCEQGAGDRPQGKKQNFNIISTSSLLSTISSINLFKNSVQSALANFTKKSLLCYLVI